MVDTAAADADSHDAGDLLQLEGAFDEDCVLDHLSQRYGRDRIYTGIGDILVSVNPYKQIGPLDAPLPDPRSFGEKSAPHLYLTAHRAWSALATLGQNQAVQVSGESGAGKTEATKILIRYLVKMSGSSGGNVVTRKKSNSRSVGQCIMQTSPLLEAFGNAKTIRNDNSSRFGKLIKLCYSADHHIQGATIQHFLLEKSRLVGHAAGERSFHIFYHLCGGATEAERAQLQLRPAAEYRYLAQGGAGAVAVKGLDDVEELESVKQALNDLGHAQESSEVRQLLQLLTGVLEVGNLELRPKADDTDGGADGGTTSGGGGGGGGGGGASESAAGARAAIAGGRLARVAEVRGERRLE
jgi:myosin-5